MIQSFFCKCGGSMTVTTSSEEGIEMGYMDFIESHSKEGCELCDKKTCHNARRRKAREEKKKQDGEE